MNEIADGALCSSAGAMGFCRWAWCQMLRWDVPGVRLEVV